MMTLCLCFLRDFPNDVALKFDIVSIVLSVCVIYFCVLGGRVLVFGFGFFGLYATCLELAIFTGASL